MKILLLEDDDATKAHLERVLSAAGHVVDVCSTGQDAIFLGSTGDHAVLILDRMVPGLDGLGALKALRAMGVRSPALFLTAMNGVEDRVEGLEAASDGKVTLGLEVEITAELAREGLAREILNRVQTQRREEGLNLSDRIRLQVFGDDDLRDAVSAHGEWIGEEALAPGGVEWAEESGEDGFRAWELPSEKEIHILLEKVNPSKDS